MNICVITDNSFLYERFREMIDSSEHSFEFYYSYSNTAFDERYRECKDFNAICLKNQPLSFYKQFDLFFSLHCKQLFPRKLVDCCRCINIHPGYNPYNRGWYPQAFGIINKKPIGVTIHEMDYELDHGPIIYREAIIIYPYETSEDVYYRIQQLEINMLEQHLEDLIEGNYETNNMESEGNVNYKGDFTKICELDLDKTASLREFIDVLRATTFSKYDNAYFIDDAGKKIYVSIKLKREK